MKYIVNKVKATGKWAIFTREGSKKTGYTDILVQVVELGLHTACAMVAQMNRDLVKP